MVHVKRMPSHECERLRECRRQRGEPAPLALTPEELQTIFRDWQVLLAAFDEA